MNKTLSLAKNYFIRHRRGELPLWKTLGINAALGKVLYIVVLVGIGPGMAFAELKNDENVSTGIGNSFTSSRPVLYLYPKKQQQVSVRLAYRGRLTTSYPAYNESIEGWNVEALPDGTLFNHEDKQIYSYIFWEGTPDKMEPDFSSGFVVSGKDTARFLQKTLKALGLTPREYNEFIVYWLPKMEMNKYNLIHFAGNEYTDTALLEINPKPDSVLRVFMIFKALDSAKNVSAQQITRFERKGFSVVEWGGAEVR